MTLNCKAGDLAIVVKSEHPANLGKLVRCKRPLTKEDLLALNSSEDGGAWEIYEPVRWVRSGGRVDWCRFIMDRCLRPIRDSDGEDEIIRIAGLPLKEHA